MPNIQDMSYTVDDLLRREERALRDRCERTRENVANLRLSLQGEEHALVEETRLHGELIRLMIDRDITPAN